MYFPVSGWAAAFLLTILVETPIAFFLLRRQAADPVRLITIILFANLATHPVVWYVISQVLLPGTPGYTVAAELWATAAETIIYWAAIRGVSVSRAIGTSVAANAASYLVGWFVADHWPELFR